MNLVRTLIVALAIGLLAAAAGACDVPVFEYAMENWPADSYELVIFHNGKPAGEAAAILDLLNKACDASAGGPNINIRLVDPSADMDEATRQVWMPLSSGTQPANSVLAALFAPGGGKTPIWSGAMDRADAEAIIDSPARRELARRLMSGQAGVWVLLESGKKDADDTAAAVLKTGIAHANQALQARAPMSPEEMEAASAPAMRNVEFSLLRISRDDAGERMFVPMLLATERDLADLSGPIAFPIFGRGRALYGFVGKGINESNIADVCAFLVGDCSCEVKAQNPGLDMLLAADWEKALWGNVAPDRDTPSPTGLTALAAPLAASVPAAAEIPDQPAASAWPLVRNILLALVGLAAVGGLLALLMRKRAAPGS